MHINWKWEMIEWGMAERTAVHATSQQGKAIENENILMIKTIIYISVIVYNEFQCG